MHAATAVAVTDLRLQGEQDHRSIAIPASSHRRLLSKSLRAPSRDNRRPDGSPAVARYPRGDHLSLADYADAVAAQTEWPTFAVVAHSIGGVVATELLARHPSRVAGILAVAAVIPRPGQSFLRCMPLPNRLILGAVLRMAGTRPPAKALRTGLANGLPEPMADRLVNDFDPESVGLYSDAASAREWPAVRAYLRTTEDREVTTATQRRSAEVLEPAWTSELRTGHLPMLLDPSGVSQAARRLLTSVGG